MNERFRKSKEVRRRQLFRRQISVHMVMLDIMAIIHPFIRLRKNNKNINSIEKALLTNSGVPIPKIPPSDPMKQSCVLERLLFFLLPTTVSCCRWFLLLFNIGCCCSTCIDRRRLVVDEKSVVVVIGTNADAPPTQSRTTEKSEMDHDIRRDDNED